MYARATVYGYFPPGEQYVSCTTEREQRDKINEDALSLGISIGDDFIERQELLQQPLSERGSVKVSPPHPTSTDGLTGFYSW